MVVKKMDLFQANEKLKKLEPLASRMRPERLEEIVGQQQIIGRGRLLRRMIEADRLSSLIFYGPPGTGKTTLALVISKASKSRFIKLSALSSGVKEIRAALEKAKTELLYYERKTICFVDEIHRLNKSQQDVFLEAVEKRRIILIGATTENPYFEVNSALLSRATIFKLEPLSSQDILILLKRALTDREQGFGNYNIKIEEEALEYLAVMANGDARNALNGLELAVITSNMQEHGLIEISLTDLEESIQRKAVVYDRTGDNHYDVVSAFIKSMRGSEPDAVLHYLAKMIDAGEEPEFIARRIIIAASEDVGLAYPTALQVAVSAAQAVKMVGFPEARIILAHAALLVACSPKSNSAYLGIDNALRDVRTKTTGQVPFHLRDSHYSGANELGYGKGYKYPHDYPGSFVSQHYLPDELQGVSYYNPSDNGLEKKIKSYLSNKR